ncbi:Na(+)/H(+) antiporter subunit B [Thermogladius sp. 4427co]|uniref:Na(+)/H(+) antiporter subunit B n=1 Tax=Thermogladius sp. 4427co TaxID=3450718 RepID=UPI003F7A1052
MTPIIMLLLAAFSSTMALIAALKIVFEKDVLKAIVISGVESLFYSILLAVFLAPDLLIAYIAVGLGLNSAILIYALRGGERYEETA